MDEATFGPLIDRLPDAVLVIDTAGVLRDANAAASDRFGWSLEERRGEDVLELIHPDDLAWSLSSLSTVVEKEVGTAIELRVQASDGWRLVELIGTAFEHEGEQLIVLAIRDLTERRKWEVARDDTELFRSLMQYSASLTLLADADGTVKAASGALIRTTGRDLEDVLDRPLAEAVVPGDRASLDHALSLLRDGDERQATIEVTLKGAGRPPVPCQLSLVDLTDDPTVGGLVISAHDISELHRARSELEHIAGHDPLTGLPNRAQLLKVLEQRLGDNDRHNATLVGFIDLDRFKPVNDLYGHDAGDELLVAVASRLKAAVRSGDLLARFGGDEFVVVADAQSPRAIEALADRLQTALTPHFELSIGQVHISASVGVVECGPGSDPDTVLAEADAAMYAEKHDRSPSQKYHPVTARRELAERLGTALEAGEFIMHYQPIVRLASGTWVGLEALVRWDHPERGLLLPDQFIDVIEDTGRSAMLGQVVLASVADDMRRLKLATGATPGIAVNTTASEIADVNYPSLIADTLREGGIDPDRLTIELSEREMLERVNRRGSAIPTSLAALADAGIHLAVDDFGTGYSSLTHLVSFPIDVIKVDRSFVAGVVHDSQRSSVIAALAGLANGTGMGLIAEGVDQPQQIPALLALGCELAQGFHFAKPMPYAAVEMAYRTETELREGTLLS